MPQSPDNLAAHDSSALELSKREMEANWLRLEQQKQKLETLKVLHAAALARWKDRRENEWKLNYAFWAGVGAVDGALLLNKGLLFVPWWCALLVGLVVIFFHAVYLWPAIERAISEIEMQKDVEGAIRVLIDSKTRKLIRSEHLGGAINRFQGKGKIKEWLWKRYGLFAPLALTAGLLAIAGVLSHRF